MMIPFRTKTLFGTEFETEADRDSSLELADDFRNINGSNLFDGFIGEVTSGEIVLADVKSIQCLRETVGFRQDRRINSSCDIYQTT